MAVLKVAQHVLEIGELARACREEPTSAAQDFFFELILHAIGLQLEAGPRRSGLEQLLAVGTKAFVFAWGMPQPPHKALDTIVACMGRRVMVHVLVDRQQVRRHVVGGGTRSKCHARPWRGKTAIVAVKRHSELDGRHRRYFE
ncbi:hypothetical protein D3C76_1309850 [compost metagenome]